MGSSPCDPKSLGVATSGLPKWYIQTRLAITRAVRGLSGWTMAWASSRRPLVCAGNLSGDMCLSNSKN